jgi:hypothetical protein
VLLAAGVLERAELDGGAEVVHLSRSHTVVSVRLGDQPPFVVKHVNPSTRQAGRSLDAELAVYRLAGSRPQLAALVPAARFLDEGRQLLVTDVAPGISLAALQGRGGPDPLASAAVGRALGAWHAGTAGCDAVPPANVPWPLQFACDSTYALATHFDQGRPVLIAFAGDPVLIPALRQSAARWLPSVVIHGDLKADNCVLDPAPGAEGHRARLVDWEFAGLGDPAWDLGSMIAEHLVLGDGAVAGGPAVLPAVRSFLANYRRGGDLPFEAPLASRVVGCTVGRLVAIAYETAASGIAAAPATGDALDLARTIAAAHAAWAGWLVDGAFV